jgi:hypothetical protein
MPLALPLWCPLCRLESYGADECACCDPSWPEPFSCCADTGNDAGGAGCGCCRRRTDCGRNPGRSTPWPAAGDVADDAAPLPLVLLAPMAAAPASDGTGPDVMPSAPTLRTKDA